MVYGAHGASRTKVARTISDACSSNDARGSHDARGLHDARGTPLIPTTHPRFASARPVVPPKGATTVPKFFVLGLFELRSVHGSTI